MTYISRFLVLSRITCLGRYSTRQLHQYPSSHYSYRYDGSDNDDDDDDDGVLLLLPVPGFSNTFLSLSYQGVLYLRSLR